MQKFATVTPSQKMMGISILRIIATLGVFAVHFGQRMRLPSPWSSVTDFGKYGVQLFFVISGFLMVQSLDKCDSVRDVFQFYVKKAIRLLPLYYLVILWFFVSETFIYRSIVPDSYRLGWLRYVFLLNGIVPADCYLWQNVGITWTIPIFIMAYIITPLWYKCLKKHTTETLGIMFVALVVLSVISANCFEGWVPFLNHYYTFVGGMLVYKALQEGKSKSVQIGLMVLILMLAAADRLFVVFLTLIFMLLVSIMYDVQIKSAKFVKLLNTVDAYSYTVYLGHGVIFCSVLDKFALPMPVRFCVAVFGSALLVIALYHLYERPITKILQTKLLKK